MHRGPLTPTVAGEEGARWEAPIHRPAGPSDFFSSAGKAPLLRFFLLHERCAYRTRDSERVVEATGRRSRFPWRQPEPPHGIGPRTGGWAAPSLVMKQMKGEKGHRGTQGTPRCNAVSSRSGFRISIRSCCCFTLWCLHFDLSVIEETRHIHRGKNTEDKGHCLRKPHSWQCLCKPSIS